MNFNFNLKIIQQSIIPLFLSTIIMALFYWQFTRVYPFIIEHFTNDKLSILYAHLFIYIFLIFTLMVSLTNLLNNIIVKSKIFVTITIASMIFFYILSYPIIKDVLDYFMNSNPLSDNAMMGMIFFLVGTLGYSLFSVGILFFKKLIPYSHIIIFTLLFVAYSAWFIDTYCYPVEEVLSKLSLSK